MGTNMKLQRILQGGRLSRWGFGFIDFARNKGYRRMLKYYVDLGY